jgi:hypothetical protein
MDDLLEVLNIGDEAARQKRGNNPWEADGGGAKGD